MNERQALVYVYRWARLHWCFPNVHFCGCEMDMAIVTRARLLWEVEVKLTASDWRADEHKAKWKRPAQRARVSRMYYAVLPEMAQAIPPFVPAETGILVFDRTHMHELRPARLTRAPKVTDAQLLHLFESTYWRFWRERSHRHREAQTARKAAA